MGCIARLHQFLNKAIFDYNFYPLLKGFYLQTQLISDGYGYRLSLNAATELIFHQSLLILL
jgi:hypothetical protein